MLSTPGLRQLTSLKCAGAVFCPSCESILTGHTDLSRIRGDPGMLEKLNKTWKQKDSCFA